MKQSFCALNLLLFVTSLLANHELPEVRQSLSIDCRFPAQSASVAGRMTLYYELHFANWANGPIRITEIKAGDAVGTIKTFAGDDLVRHFPHPRNDGNSVLVSGAHSIAFFELPMPTKRHSSELIHRVTIRFEDGTTAQIAAPPVKIDQDKALLLGPPLRTGTWIAVYDPSWERGHRRVVHALDGHATIPGRLAVDFFGVFPDGATAREGGRLLTDYAGYGADVLAVADATVVALRDDLRETLILKQRSPVPLVDETGNFIGLDLGEGRTAFYEHLQSDIPVKLGDRVRAGQIIGKLGLSGSGTGPHLHLHVGAGTNPLLAEGLAYSLSSWTKIGRLLNVAKLGSEPWKHETALPGKGLPEPLTVLTFRARSENLQKTLSEPVDSLGPRPD